MSPIGLKEEPFLDIHNIETLTLSIIFACFTVLLTILGFLSKIVFNYVWKRQEKQEQDIQALWNYVRGNARQYNGSRQHRQERSEK